MALDKLLEISNFNPVIKRQLHAVASSSSYTHFTGDNTLVVLRHGLNEDIHVGIHFLKRTLHQNVNITACLHHTRFSPTSVLFIANKSPPAKLLLVTCTGLIWIQFSEVLV